MFPAGSSSLTVWSCGSAGLLVLLASALILSPSLLLFLSQTGTQQRSVLTALEAFLAVHFGVYLVAVAVALILNTPETTPLVPPKRDNAPSHPLLAPITIASNLLAFISWNTKNVGALATVTFVINGVVGIWGLWTMLFCSSSSISKTTGADKHTSAFLFGNKAAASSQKKAAKGNK